MLGFFRKYQKYFFAVITVVIVISFSFFGTYSAIANQSIKDEVVFTAINGKQIKRSDFEDFVLFIATDKDDKRNLRGIWGPNFLNDGLISKDFIETGLAQVLISQYPDYIQDDLTIRHKKEKNYKPYSHPQAKFVSAENIWAYVAPGIKLNLDKLRKSDDPTSEEALEARHQLYLEEKKLPASNLQQYLEYQQSQYNWLPADPNLGRTDLSLFGYHTVEDWYGPKFVRLIAEFVINSAIIAEQQGYTIAKEEVLADLIRNGNISFKENQQNPYLGVRNSSEYYQEQMRRMRMDESKAIRIWKQVMLFRRYFHDVGNSIVLDPMTFNVFNAYAKEEIDGELYRLPQELCFSDFRSLQKFELYIDLVSRRPRTIKGRLKLPEKFQRTSLVDRKAPELVQRRYLLEIASVDKKSLQSQVGVKETWNWEVKPDNWKRLINKFTELGMKKGDSEEMRYQALESLDTDTRARVDSYAREEIVNEHPEWINDALEKEETKTEVVSLRKRGGSTPFRGLKDRKELMKILDEAELEEVLPRFTADNNTYYYIKLIDRSPEKEILTFAEANQEGILDELLDRKLEAHYLKIRKDEPEKYQADDMSWRDFDSVKDFVAEDYFKKTLKAIRTDYARKTTEIPNQMLATLRFFAHGKDVLKKLKDNSDDVEKFIKLHQEPIQSNKIGERSPLTDQWKFVKVHYKSDRSSYDATIDKDALFELADGNWSEVMTPANGEIHFFKLSQKKGGSNSQTLTEQIRKSRKILSDDAQRDLMSKLLNEMRDSMTLDYMKKSDG